MDFRYLLGNLNLLILDNNFGAKLKIILCTTKVLGLISGWVVGKRFTTIQHIKVAFNVAIYLKSIFLEYCNFKIS